MEKIKYTLRIYLVSNSHITLNYSNKKRCQALFDSIEENLSKENPTHFTITGPSTLPYLVRYKYITHIGMSKVDKNVQETKTGTPK